MNIIDNIQYLENIKNKNSNAFILCNNSSDIMIISEVFSVEFANSISHNLPFIIRIGSGKIKDVIFEKEWPSQFTNYDILNISNYD